MGSKKKRITRKDAKKASAQPKVIPKLSPSDQKQLDELYLEMNFMAFRVDQARRIFENVKYLFVPDGNRPNLMFNRLKLRMVMKEFQHEKPPRLVMPDTSIVVTGEMIFVLREYLKMCLYDMVEKGGDLAWCVLDCGGTSTYDGWCVGDLLLYQELQFTLLTMFTGIVNFQGTTLQNEFSMEVVWKKCLPFFGVEHPDMKAALAVTKYIVTFLAETLIFSATSLDRRAAVYGPSSTDHSTEWTNFLTSHLHCASSSSMMGCAKRAKLTDD